MSGGSMIFGHVNPVEPGLTGLLFISEIVPEDIFRLKKFLLLFVFTVSFPLRSIDRVCFNNLPVERWSNCIFTRLPPSLTWLIVSRNSSDCWTIEILWSGKRNELNSCSSFYYWLGNGNFYIETRLFSGNWFYPFILAHDTTILPN